MDRIRRRRALFVLLVLAASVLGPAASASAHALLVTATPSANAVLPDSPSRVLLTFTERVNVLDDSIRVVSGDGTPVATGVAHHEGGSNTIAVDLPVLATGSYVVAWKTLSVESHPITGGYVFSVGEAGRIEPGLLQDLLNRGQPAQRDQVALGLGRSLTYGGLALLVGVLGVALWCIPTQVPGRRIGTLLWVGVVAGVAGTALMISSQASSAAGSWTSWDAVIRTDAGRWWLASLVEFVVAGALVAARRHADAWWWRIAAVVLAAALVAFTAASGSALAGDLVVLGFVSTVVHLLAMAALVGCIGVVGATVDGKRWLVTRVGPLALGSLGVLVLTGVVNAWRESSSWEALVGANYGRWLLVKGVVVVVAVLAGAGTYRWAGAPDIDDAERARRVNGAVALQVVAVVLVLGATSGLVSSPPPGPRAPQAVVTVDVVVDQRIAQITLDPAVIGGTTMHVYITSANGSLQQPRTITVSASLPAQGLGPLELPLQTAGPGHVTGSGVDFSLPGVWTIDVVATYGAGDVTTFTTRMEVR